MKKNYIALSILVLSVSIIFSSVWLGMKFESNKDYEHKELLTSDVLTMTEVAEYLNLSEKEIEKIIAVEKNALERTGSFYGKMFPYFEVNNKKLFYKEEIDLWLKEAVVEKKKY